MYLNHIQRLRRTHKYVFFALCICILFLVYAPLVVHADAFGLEIYDIYEAITSETKEVNDLLTNAFAFCSTSPYDVVNKISDAATANAIRDATKTVAFVVATLLLMVDFFKKSTTFEWASKWENILLFLVKVILVKQVIQNSDAIIVSIYDLFNYINRQAVKAVCGDFMPYGTAKTYTIEIQRGFMEHMIEDQSGSIVTKFAKNWYNYWFDVGADNIEKPYKYVISEEAVKTFYPQADFSKLHGLSNNYVKYEDAPKFFLNPTTNINYNPTLDYALYIKPYFLIMKAIVYLIYAMAIGRVFELSLYTFFAPLPIATFASDTTHDVAKNFLKNYIAVIIQIAVMVVMFMLYFAMVKYFSDQANGGLAQLKGYQIICLFSLGMGIFKSGTWSRQICGIA